jgi:hypothetical protein
MNRRKFSAAASRVALALACASALSPRPARAGSAQTPKPSTVFQEARAVNDNATPDPEAFEFEMKGFAYHIRQNGNGRRTKGKRSRGFNLRLDSGDSVSQLFYTEFEGDLLLLLHVGGAGSGVVTRLEQPSMRGLWRQRIAASDVGHPLRDGHDLYVTGAGFVGKLDLRTGEYVWQHGGLADARGGGPKPLKAFDEPELKGDAVLFRERPVYNPRRTVVVDKKTGEVIRVE